VKKLRVRSPCYEGGNHVPSFRDGGGHSGCRRYRHVGCWCQRSAVTADLKGFNEIGSIPAAYSGAVLSDGTGTAKLVLNKMAGTVTYTLTYSNVGTTPPQTGTVSQAHIHFGKTRDSGGILVFLCTNLPLPPTFTGGGRLHRTVPRIAEQSPGRGKGLTSKRSRGRMLWPAISTHWWLRSNPLRPMRMSIPHLRGPRRLLTRPIRRAKSVGRFFPLKRTASRATRTSNKYDADLNSLKRQSPGPTPSGARRTDRPWGWGVGGRGGPAKTTRYGRSVVPVVLEDGHRHRAPRRAGWQPRPVVSHGGAMCALGRLSPVRPRMVTRR